MKNFRTVALAAALALGSAAAAQAAIVTNGSFEEAPGVTGTYNGNDFGSMVGASGNASWDIWNGLPGWGTQSSGVEVQTANTIPLTPADGDYYVELDTTENSGIFQDVFLSVGKYVMSFLYAPRETNITTNTISFGVNTIFSNIAKGPNATYPIGTWTQVSEMFTVDVAGTYRLFFDAADNSDSFGGFVDDVQINPIPVPAAGLLLLTALGGIAAIRRRKTA